MSASEVGQGIKVMERQDLDVIRNIVEERSAVIKKMEVDTLAITVALGTFASYTKGQYQGIPQGSSGGS